MPSGVYERSPEHKARLRKRMLEIRATPGWEERAAKTRFKPGNIPHPTNWTPELRKKHGEIMTKAGVITKLHRGRKQSRCEVILKPWLEELGFIWQYKIEGAGLADYALPGKKIVIEFEAEFFDENGRGRAAKKLRMYRELGWKCLIFGYWHVSQYPDHVKECIRNAIV